MAVWFATGAAAPALAAEPRHTFHAVSVSGDYDSPQGTSLRIFAERIEANSRGEIEINVFYQNELGLQQEIFDQFLKGNLHILLAWPQTSYDQRLGVTFMPYLTIGWDDAIRAYGEGGWLVAVIRRIFEENGIRFFGPYPEGFGGIATKGRYATNFEDAQGIEVRSQTIFPLPQTIRAMGFNAVPIDWSEVYTSIQTGIVDGDSSNVIYWDYEYFGDQLDYYVHSRHNFASAALLMNNSVWNELSPADQAIVGESARFIIEKQFADARTEDEKWIRIAQEGGMEYIEPTREELASWVRRVRSEVWSQVEDTFGAETMETIRANASEPQ